MNVERLRRSVLLVPASDARRMSAAASSEADGVMLDLEDTVTRGAKPLALDNAVAALSRRDFGQKELVVRINALATAQGRRDLDVIAAARPQAVCLPKIGAVADLLRADRAVAEIEATHRLEPGAIRLYVMIGTASGVSHAAVIARSSPRLDALLYDGGDYLREAQAVPSTERSEQLYAMTKTLLAARAAFLDALDGPALDLTEGAVEREARQARAIGYSGKTVVDPRHVAAVHRVFTPSPDEVERALRLIQAYHDAEAGGVGVLEVDGHFVDAARVRIARRVVRQAELAGALRLGSRA